MVGMDFVWDEKQIKAHVHSAPDSLELTYTAR